MATREDPTAREAAIERLDAVRMQARLPEQAIDHRPLHTVAKDPIEGMGDDRQPALFRESIETALDAESRRNAALDEEGEQMALASADLLADDELEALRAARRQQIARAQGAVEAYRDR